VLDIGANIGAHTLLLAQLVGPQGRVLSFEPTQFAFLKQKRNLELNPDLADRVQPFQCLLSSQDGAPLPQALYSSWPLTKPQNVHAKHMGEEMPTAAASARRLDSILEEIGNPRVRLVKLDVDGNECDVLEGAINLLKTHRPVFVMELAPYVLDERGASLEKLLSLFHPHGYKFYDERTERPLPSTALEMSRLIRDGESINIIARTN
jgi:FkbM family methyltransferase